MNKDLTIIFFEDYFVCTILPNENVWEILAVNGVNKQLLYFYVKDNVIRNDEFAKERFQLNDNDAFGDFYNAILDDTKTFTKFDLKFPSINLLRDVLEQVKISYAERIQDFSGDYNSKDEVPLNICFIPGIDIKAHNCIIDFFAKEGFRVRQKADYFVSLLSILDRKRVINDKINFSIVESYFGDLFFHYVEFDKSIKKLETEKIIGKGVDHRVGNLAKLIVEAAAKRTSSRIFFDAPLLEQEIKRFHKKAHEEMGNFLYGELDVTVELSDFNKARVIIDMRDLEKMSSQSFEFIKFKYESFISKHSILARTEKILLNGEAFSSESFIQFFEKTYGSSKIIKPFDNFAELLSRGIYSAYADRDSNHVYRNSGNDIEIKITVKASKSSAPAPPPPPSLPKTSKNIDQPKLPPVPTNGIAKVAVPPPPIPRTSKNGNKNNGSDESNVVGAAAATDNGSSIKKPPPPPPIPRKK